MSSITPTIGRKVWFWASENFFDAVEDEALNDQQAFDATIVYVQPNGNVNLWVTTHTGEGGLVENCQLRDHQGDEAHGGEEDFATWMPYQMGQAKKDFAEAKKAEDGK